MEPNTAEEAERYRLAQFGTFVHSEIRAALLDHEVLMRDIEGSKRITRADLQAQASFFRTMATDAMRALVQSLDEHP